MFMGESGGESVEEDDCGLDDAVLLEVEKEVAPLCF